MLKTERYPQPEAREALARCHGLERKRVDRWPIVVSVAPCPLLRTTTDVGPLRQHTWTKFRGDSGGGGIDATLRVIRASWCNKHRNSLQTRRSDRAW